MPTLKLHYDEWVALPATVRQQLGLSSGDKLDVALVDGTIVLRLAAKATRPVQNVGPEEAVDAPAPDAIRHAAHPEVAPARRGPGRPRKHQAGADAGSSAPKRPRGRPKRILAPAVELPPAPIVNSERWKLRRKEDLQARKPRAPLPSPLPYRSGSEAGSPAEERRPFRNVEVRKLGPRRPPHSAWQPREQRHEQVRADQATGHRPPASPPARHREDRGHNV